MIARAVIESSSGEHVGEGVTLIDGIPPDMQPAPIIGILCDEFRINGKCRLTGGLGIGQLAPRLTRWRAKRHQECMGFTITAGEQRDLFTVRLARSAMGLEAIQDAFRAFLGSTIFRRESVEGATEDSGTSIRGGGGLGMIARLGSGCGVGATLADCTTCQEYDECHASNDEALGTGRLGTPPREESLPIGLQLLH